MDHKKENAVVSPKVFEKIRGAILLGVTVSGSPEHVLALLNSDNIFNGIALAANRAIGVGRGSTQPDQILLPMGPLRIEDAAKMNVRDCYNFLNTLSRQINNAGAGLVPPPNWSGGVMADALSHGHDTIAYVIPIVLAYYTKSPKILAGDFGFDALQLAQSCISMDVSLEESQRDYEEAQGFSGQSGVSYQSLRILSFNYFMKACQSGLDLAIELHKNSILESVEDICDYNEKIESVNINGLDFAACFQGGAKTSFAIPWVKSEVVRQKISLAICEEMKDKMKTVHNAQTSQGAQVTQASPINMMSDSMNWAEHEFMMGSKHTQGKYVDPDGVPCYLN